MSIEKDGDCYANGTKTKSKAFVEGKMYGSIDDSLKLKVKKQQKQYILLDELKALLQKTNKLLKKR